MSWYIECLKKYAQFSGRARRKEYWMFVLFNVLIAVALTILDDLTTGSRVLVNLYQLAVLVPSLAVGVRRMHDTDHNGWWLLVPFASLILAIREGGGDNRYGPDPKPTVIQSQVAA